MQNPVTFLQALTLLLIALKLTNHIDWSWWFVWLPACVPFVLKCLDSFIGAVIAGFIEAAKRK